MNHPPPVSPAASAWTPPRVIAIMGPTACGKSSLAEAICRQRPCEIISVDSALVYRGMDIGTAKPSRAIREEIPHHLIDIIEPEQAFSAAEFVAAALRAIADIHSRGKVPLLVGGTMLYFRALFEGLAPLPGASDSVRARLIQETEALGLDALHRRLAAVDPSSAERIHPNDPQRIQRALEVFEVTGRPLSEIWREADRYEFPYPLTCIAIGLTDRALLHERIARRLDEMFAAGFVEEVVRLRRRPELAADMPSMRAVGYRQVWEHLAGEFDYDTLRQRALFATRQLAKRQMTWLRRMQKVQWIEADGAEIVTSVLKILDQAPC